MASNARRRVLTDDEDESNPAGPLLPTLAHEDPSTSTRTTDHHHMTQKMRPLSTLVFYFMAIHFLLAFCEIILVAPLMRLFENSLCLSHFGFPVEGVKESLCKIPEVQKPLATIRGWKSMFDTIPVLLVAIPIGRLGDHYGRRKILAMALIGVAGSLTEVFVVCAFPEKLPLQLVWISSMILLFGGGLNSASAYMWAMASESIPADRRSHGFYYIFSAFYVAELIASFVASVTTDITPWIPCGLAMGSLILCLLLLFLMPDPRKSKDNTYNRVPTEDPITGDVSEDLESSHKPREDFSIHGLKAAFSHRKILLVVPVFLVGIFRYSTLNILIQYASVRFDMPISRGATFYTETAVVNIFLFLFLIPRLTDYIRKEYKVRPMRIDLFLVRTSVTLMSVGAMCIGLSPSSKILPVGVFIFAAGFGSRVSALSFVSYWISDEAKATLYAAITVLESLGHAFGDPSMQQIFAASLNLAPFWHAMPFFVAAIFYGLATTSTTFIHMDKGNDELMEDVAVE